LLLLRFFQTTPTRSQRSEPLPVFKTRERAEYELECRKTLFYNWSKSKNALRLAALWTHVAKTFPDVVKDAELS
jgi:hypothetical protein